MGPAGGGAGQPPLEQGGVGEEQRGDPSRDVVFEVEVELGDEDPEEPGFFRDDQVADELDADAEGEEQGDEAEERDLAAASVSRVGGRHG